MKVIETAIPGCLILRHPVPRDERGMFAKPFHAPSLESRGLNFHVAECFWSESMAGIVRGMHFQRPPFDHAKIITCQHGRAWDVVVDVRQGSPTYGQSIGIELEAGDGQAVLIPSGCAHGFQALLDATLMLYLVSRAHAPDHDSGIRWDSCGIKWALPVNSVSLRDSALPSLQDFASPFTWEGKV